MATTTGAPGYFDPNKDYAWLINYEKSKANPNWDQISTWSQERENKIAASGDKYVGVKPTSELLSGTPVAEQFKSTPGTLGTLPPPVYDKLTSPRGDPKIKGPQGPQGNAEIDNLIATLKSLSSQPLPTFPVLSYQNALQQAGSELNPLYDNSKKELMRTTDIDLEKRGIYNAPLAGGIVAEKSGTFEAGRNSAIATKADDLVAQSQDNALKQQQLYLQDRTQRADSIASLLSILSNRELSEAELTGVYQGIKTLAAQQAEADNKFKESQVTGYYNGQPTLDRQQYETDAALKEGQLTGYYKNNPTLGKMEFDLNRYKTDMDAALARLQSLGRVTTEADAALLGVPVGTTSFQAQDAIAERKLKLDMLTKQLAADAAEAAANRQLEKDLSADELAKQSVSNTLESLNKDLTIWELTGKAPNTPALQSYGIAEGTPWTGTVQDQAASIQLDADKAAAKQAKIDKAIDMFSGNIVDALKDKDLTGTGFTSDPTTVEAVFTIMFNHPIKTEGMAIFSANKKALQKEGVQLDKAEAMLNSYYDNNNGDVTQFLALDQIDKWPG